MLQVNSLSFHHGKQALIDKISLSFSPGILYALVGPNGAGKSTLLKTMMRIWKPSFGNVNWNQKEILTLPQKEISQIFSFVPQSPTIPFDFTVIEIVQMGRYSCAQSASNELIEWGLKLLDVWQFKDRRMTELSQGEKQRVYIARALITESPILLLDEPTANLDIRHQLEIWQLLKDLSQKGKIVIVANHDLISTKRFADQVAVLSQGKCVAKGLTNEILSQKVLEDFFGLQPGIDINDTTLLKNNG